MSKRFNFLKKIEEFRKKVCFFQPSLEVKMLTHWPGRLLMRRKGWAIWSRGCSQGLPVGSEGSPIRPRALPFGSLHLYLGNFNKDQDKLSNKEAHSLLIRYHGLGRHSNPTSRPRDECITVLALLFGMLANGKEASINSIPVTNR